jgi:hypothetical protein
LLRLYPRSVYCYACGYAAGGVAFYFAVLFLLGGLFAAQVYNHPYVDHQPQPVERDVRVCQEHSGGDNRCPGG